MKKKLFFSLYIAAFSLATSLSSFAAIPSGYYDGMEGKSGVSLKKAVKAAAKNHTAIDYGTSTWQVFIESDTRIVGGQRCWWDMYSNDNVPAPSASSHPGMNIEHSVANSWWGGTKNDAYKDLMHLNPSNSDANSRKSNYPLGEIQTHTWDNGITFIGKPRSGDCGGATYVYEPADEYKGDFARVFFYMFTIYDNISWKTSSGYGYMYEPSSDLLLKPWAYEMLLRWAKEDPVSQKEIERNEAIYKHQKNRNPFIDCPELAEHIWGSKKNSPFHFDGTVDPDPDPDPDDPVIPATPVDGGYWYAVTSSADLNTSDKYILVSTDNKVVMAYKTNGNTNVTYFQPCSVAPKFDSSVSPARISEIPADAAILSLGKTGSNWTIGVSDKDGKTYGYLSSTETKKVSLASSASASGTTLTISPNSESTSIKFTAAGGNLQYNNQENGKRFTTYTSSQEPVMLYRLEEENNGNGDAGIDTGLPETADETIYGIYLIDGTKVAAESIYDLPKGIYIVISNFGTKKILK